MFKFEFTQEEVGLIVDSLAGQPFKLVSRLIPKIVEEFNKQTAPKESVDA